MTGLYFLLAVVFLVLNGIFNGSETGFVCLDPEHLSLKAKSMKGQGISRILKLARHPERFLALTLIGINLCLVLATALITGILERMGPMWVTIGTALISIFIFLVCELIPKMAFTNRPLDALLRVLPILRAADWMLTWPVTAITAVTRTVMSLFGTKQERGRSISREELLILLSHGVHSGVIAEQPRLMVSGIIGLKETIVFEVMVPRPRIRGISADATPEEAMNLIVSSGFSRIPIFQGSIDQVVGVIYFKDLFLKGESVASLRDIAAKPVFVPETKNAFDLFRELLKQNRNVALVLDEFGSTTGLVTLEDLIEEVVGEIHDEFDKPSGELKYHDDGSISVKANLSLDEFFRETGIRLPESDDVMTINGLILSILGRIPAPGEGVKIGKYRFVILEAAETRVDSVRVYSKKEVVGS